MVCEQLMVGAERAEKTPTVLLYSNATAHDMHDIGVAETLRHANVSFSKCNSSGPSSSLVINDTTITSECAMMRAASKLARTYPQDVEDAGVIDDWIDMHESFMQPIRAVLNPSGETTRDWVNKVHIPKSLQLLEDEIKNRGWIGGMDRLSMADIRWFKTLEWLRKNKEDFCFDPVKYPNLQEYCDEIAELMSREEFELFELESSDKESDPEDAEHSKCD